MTGTFATSNYPKCDAVYWDKPVNEKVSGMRFPVPTREDDEERRHRQVLPNGRLWL